MMTATRLYLFSCLLACSIFSPAASFTPASWSPVARSSASCPSSSADTTTTTPSWALQQASRTLTLPVLDTTASAPYQLGQNYFNEPQVSSPRRRAGRSSSSSSHDSVLLRHGNAAAPALVATDVPTRRPSAAAVTSSPATKLVRSFQKKLEKWGGLSTVMSYYFVSHVNSAITLTLSWYIHAARTGLSPLAPGQQKVFLSIYSGFFVFSNVIRPLRVAAAVALSPTYDKLMRNIGQHFGTSNHKIQTALLTVLFTNVAVGAGIVVAGITTTAAVTGVPILP